jgi:hypothetical protein
MNQEREQILKVLEENFSRLLWVGLKDLLKNACFVASEVMVGGFFLFMVGSWLYSCAR